MVTMRVAGAVVLLLGLMVAGCATPSKVAAEPGVGLPAELEPSSFGYLKHRERMYRLEDLLDACFRVASEDPFVQRFQPQETYAGWAGL